jgi:ABC-type Zn uptake system ZnuABC Zn-binding protein ZnuA
VRTRASIAWRPAVIAGLSVIVACCHVDAAAARIAVIATTSDVASLVTVVGGDLVQVTSIIPPTANPEEFEPKASDLATLNDADLIVRVGLGYDFSIDKLIERFGRPDLQQAGARSVDVSAGIPLLEAAGRNPVAGDGHAHGSANPHYWLDPANAEIITATIATAIIRIAPGARDVVSANRNRFLSDLRDRLAAWKEKLAPYQGATFVAYHNSWPYFARRFRLNIIGFIEPKEGVAPSAAHLAALIAKIRQNRVRAIIQEIYEPTRHSEMLSARTGVPLVLLAPTVGSVPQATDYLSFIDYNVRLLAGTLAATR